MCQAGLVIGNEAVWDRLSGPGDLTPRLLGMDLLRWLEVVLLVLMLVSVLVLVEGRAKGVTWHLARLGLERAVTAREAVTVITQLLEEYGQVGRELGWVACPCLLLGRAVLGHRA